MFNCFAIDIGVQVEKVPDAENLMKRQTPRATHLPYTAPGRSKYYTPEELVGKIIVVVANLKPARTRGVESYGMLLAAKTGDDLRLVTVDTPDFPSGVSVG